MTASRFPALVAERAALGHQLYGSDDRPVSDLLDALVHEFVDAYNYAAMELDRLRHSDRGGDRIVADLIGKVVALVGLCRGAAHLAAEHRDRITGVTTDVGLLAYARMNGPAAKEYGYDSYLYRDNFAELVEELADAYLICRTVLAAPQRQADAEPYEELAVISQILAEVSMDVGASVLAQLPPARPPSSVTRSHTTTKDST